MTKRCTDCGVIFQTDDPEKERCDICEDDRAPDGEGGVGNGQSDTED